MNPPRHPAVFLDRDGTLIEDPGYPSRPEQIRILGGTARGLDRLAGAGFKLVVITNQSAVARGILTENELTRFHEALDAQLNLLGVHVDAYYACPHHPDPAKAQRRDLAVDCECRKPKPGMILRAAEDLGLDLASSWVVGDSWRDVGAGQAAGVRTIKLPPPLGRETPRPPEIDPPDAEAANLDDAADVILGLRSLPQTAPAAEARQAALPFDQEETAGTAAPEQAPTGEEPVEPSAAEAEGGAQDHAEEQDESASPADARTGAAQESPQPAPRPGDEAALLREVLTELRRLARARQVPSLSFLRLLAYILQAAALFSAIAMPFVVDWKMPGQDKMMYLQIAILLQLMVVTLLVVERKS